MRHLTIRVIEVLRRAFQWRLAFPGHYFPDLRKSRLELRFFAGLDVIRHKHGLRVCFPESLVRCRTAGKAYRRTDKQQTYVLCVRRSWIKRGRLISAKQDHFHSRMKWDCRFLQVRSPKLPRSSNGGTDEGLLPKPDAGRVGSPLRAGRTNKNRDIRMRL